MHENVSLCVLRPGMCAKQADCPDLHCPGRAEAIATARARMFNVGMAGRMSTDARADCTVCQDDCPTPTACQMPERPPQFRPTFDLEGPHFPKTREGWGRLVGAVLGIAGAAFFAGAAGRHFGLW